MLADVEQPESGAELRAQRDQLALELRAATPGRRAGRPRCAPAGSTSGSHGSPVAEAAVRDASHCIGWRAASRPARSYGGSRAGAVGQADLVALVHERRPGSVSSSIAAARSFSRPKRVGKRAKSWFDSTQARPARRRGAARRPRSRRAAAPASQRRVEQLEAERAVEVLQVGRELARPAGRPRRPAARRRPPRAAPRAPRRCPGRCASRGARAARTRGSGSAERLARGRVVAQLGVLQQPVDRVEPEAVDAALEPEPDHVLHRRHHLGVAPVEVGLLGVEGVQVPAPAARSRLHAGPPNADDPVVRRPVARRDQMYQSGCSRNQGCSIEVWQGTRSISTLSPRSCAAATSRRSRQRAEHRVDVRVVRHVVAEVGQRRRVDRREPQRVDAEPARWSRRASMPRRSPTPSPSESWNERG